jgi:hypothetical protein
MKKRMIFGRVRVIGAPSAFCLQNKGTTEPE